MGWTSEQARSLANRILSFRPVNPQNAMATGLTRDGVWLIEKGNIAMSPAPRAALAPASPRTWGSRLSHGAHAPCYCNVARFAGCAGDG